jgi:hypothetical protein
MRKNPYDRAAGAGLPGAAGGGHLLPTGEPVNAIVKRFFGGHVTEATAAPLKDQLRAEAQKAEELAHLDFHRAALLAGTVGSVGSGGRITPVF